ncbi:MULTISPECIES: zincin-like metallopeptidase toxin domain-containing protein [Flavobacterium]|uniref:Zincin-like metallopeptidase toxin domain-containing protein n=1 Tax=Flavobacterium jumunjinense TaxID=998845 RepID=A0ABV5GNE0_9FLAO|nr:MULTISPECIES: zincin-like metallopeptidase toxin domain-containing protein [Flavobacterium]
MSGEITVAIKNGLQKSAKEVLEHTDDLKKTAKNADEAKQIDEVIEHLRRVSGDNIKGKGFYGGKVLSKSDIEKWAKHLKKKYGTNLEKVDDFENPNVLAQFDANTNTIRYKDDVTEYFMLHESFHAEEFKKIGFDEYVKDAPLRGVKEADYTNENWIRLYKREKYVYDRLVENAKKYKLNSEEISTPPFGHAFQYFDGQIVLQLEIYQSLKIKIMINKELEKKLEQFLIENIIKNQLSI